MTPEEKYTLNEFVKFLGNNIQSASWSEWVKFAQEIIAKEHERTSSMVMWKDTTSYSKGQSRIPTCWSARIGKLRVNVLNIHIDYPGEWVMYCKPFYDTYKLNVETKEEAQAKALALIKMELIQSLNDIGENE